MTTIYKDNDPKKGLKWKPKQGDVQLVVTPPVDGIEETGFYLVGGYTRTPEKLVSFKNSSSISDSNIKFQGDQPPQETPPQAKPPVEEEEDVEEEVSDSPPTNVGEEEVPVSPQSNPETPEVKSINTKKR